MTQTPSGAFTIASDVKAQYRSRSLRSLKHLCVWMLFVILLACACENPVATPPPKPPTPPPPDYTLTGKGRGEVNGHAGYWVEVLVDGQLREVEIPDACNRRILERKPKLLPPECRHGVDGCDPNYAGACVPRFPPDVNCPQIPANDFESFGSDPHRLDLDKDGLACESTDH